MRCDECKHWKAREDGDIGYKFGLGTCNGIPMFWNATTWDGEGERVLMEKHKHSGAFLQDGSDYIAYALTKPDFFCANYCPHPSLPQTETDNP